MSPKTKEVWKRIYAILFYILIFFGIDWLFCAGGYSSLQTHLIVGAALLLHLYVLVWGSLQPIKKKQNWIIFGVLLFLIVCLFYWIGWLCDLTSYFDSEGWHLQSTKRKYFGLDWPYWAFVINAIFFVLMIYVDLYVAYCFLYPKYLIQSKSSTPKGAKGLGLFGTIGAAMFLDDHFNRKKKHDHKLGSYWSDHDDDGNYDPGAWRRKYDRH